MMANSASNLFDTALEESAIKHFELLFSVLMTDPSPESFTRFETGLDRLVTVAGQVDELIQGKYGGKEDEATS